ncbi:UNVERIFIED_ORG: hypothetical protein ABIB63_002707 [Xanthomonas axonopodis]
MRGLLRYGHGWRPGQTQTPTPLTRLNVQRATCVCDAADHLRDTLPDCGVASQQTARRCPPYYKAAEESGT